MIGPSTTFALMLALALAACASTPTQLPEFKQPPSISISKETVSTFTEVPAEDYLIPGSQVFVAGKGGAGRYLALLGMAIDKARNESQVGASADALRVTFDEQLAQALKTQGEKSAWQRPVTVLPAGGDVLVIPAARIVMREDESKADLSFRVTMRFNDAASGSQGRKNYFYVYGIRPLSGPGGWAADNGALLKQAASEAMGPLAKVILDDLAGSYRASAEPGQERLIKWKPLTSEQVFTSVVLREEPGYYILRPRFKDRPVIGVVVIAPKQLVRLEP